MPDFSPAVPHPGTPLAPSVRFESRVTKGIAMEVLTAFRAKPDYAGEAGGILLGARLGAPVVVKDFEPVLCEHSFGSSFLLSEDDLRGLEESVQWFAST